MSTASDRWPRITVVTPSYNQAAYLRQTIQSVLSQGYPNLQYVVIDGGSTDESVRIIEECAEGIDHWVSEPDKGQSDAINKGLSLADGEIVTWINSDDLLMPGALEAAGMMWRRQPDLHLLSGECMRIGPRGEFLFWHTVPRQTAWFARRGLIYIDQPGTFWKNGLLPPPILDTELVGLMDHDLWYRLALLGGKTCRIKRCLAAFRYHPTSKSSTIQDTFRQEAIRLRQRYCAGRTRAPLSAWMLYRVWKVLNGDYLRRLYKSRFPEKDILRHLKVLAGGRPQ